ncbi:MAG: hypothetical protein ICV74_09925, partial [Thermoleophilia bacterium]|nr:hypothetical protein [Thermoleophilia bacterium]
AGAGLALGLSQLFGGWTKWGWPTLSPTVFLLGFLPTLVVGGWILLAKQPQAGIEEGRFDEWSGSLGVSGLVNALFELWPAIPFVIGLVLAFSFDTTGPRARFLAPEHAPADEDVHDYRREDVRVDDYRRDDAGTREEVREGDAATRRELAEREDGERSVAEELRGREPERTETGARTNDRRGTF